MTDVFISYARDEQSRARLFKENLEALGLSVFFDIDGGIDAGQAFPQRITEGIRSSRAVLALWSKTALSRDWVRRECMMARDSQKLVATAVASLLPNELPAEFYDVNFEDLSDYEGQEKHWGWSQTLASIARRLEAWTDANPSDASAVRVLDLANSLRKASLAHRGEGAYQENAPIDRASASALWAELISTTDVPRLLRFANSFPGRPEAFQARERAYTLQQELRQFEAVSWNSSNAVREFISSNPTHHRIEEAHRRLAAAIENEAIQASARAQLAHSAAERAEREKRSAAERSARERDNHARQEAERHERAKAELAREEVIRSAGERAEATHFSAYWTIVLLVTVLVFATQAYLAPLGFLENEGKRWWLWAPYGVILGGCAWTAFSLENRILAFAVSVGVLLAVFKVTGTLIMALLTIPFYAFGILP